MIGALKLADDIRPESRDAVNALHRLGVEVVMITGDAQAVAHTVGAELGVDRVYAGVRPEDKAGRVAELKRRAAWSPWSATGSTMRPPSPPPTSASRSAQAPTSPSPPPEWCSRA